MRHAYQWSTGAVSANHSHNGYACACGTRVIILHSSVMSGRDEEGWFGGYKVTIYHIGGFQYVADRELNQEYIEALEKPHDRADREARRPVGQDPI